MRQQGGGKIIQISSGLGRVGIPLHTGYCASKFALEGFSEALRYELLPFRIYVSLIEPGPVKTEFGKKLHISYTNDSPYKRFYRSFEYDWWRSPVASSAEEVAKVAYRIATSSSPNLRYTVGVGGRLSSLKNYLPEEFTEFWMRLVFS